ncbi:MAG TPA: sugar phosphate nucleotidyltransferase, partial [Pyrinomonadaceae bacterium]|nr:sugar phosphate nucleotidyltransferase [Pyrinomonadaceae bacterium]
RDWRIDTLLILSGDHLYRMDYKKFLARHYETDADVTVSVIPVPPEGASEFGLLKTDDAGRIVEFSEKPKGDALEAMRVDTAALGLTAAEASTRPFLASMGIYVFKYERLEQLLREDTTHMDFGREVIPGSIDRYNVQAFLFNGYWEDIGTIGAFYKANLDMTTAIPPFNLFDAEAPMFTRARYLPPSKINKCEILESIISEGCIINGAKINHSLIGLRSRLGEGVQLEASYMMGADYYQTLEDMQADRATGRPWIGVGEGSIIRRAIIDKNARIGAQVKLLNEAGAENADGPDGSYYIRDRIIIVPKNGTIADGTVV